MGGSAVVSWMSCSRSKHLEMVVMVVMRVREIYGEKANEIGTGRVKYPPSEETTLPAMAQANEGTI